MTRSSAPSLARILGSAGAIAGSRFVYNVDRMVAALETGASCVPHRNRRCHLALRLA